MATGRPRFYWDTAPLIAWITDEKRDDPAEMDGLAEVVEMVERGDAVMMTSVLWRAEVLDMALTPAQRRRLESVYDGRNVIELSKKQNAMSIISFLPHSRTIAVNKQGFRSV